MEEKGQTLTVEMNEPKVLAADRDMLFQAFANLLDNAIKYTPEQGAVSIRSFTDDERWYLEITDNGPGIPDEAHEKVVQRFYRLDQSRTTPGSGLGLALVHAVLKLHKLELLFADNKPGLKVTVSASVAEEDEEHAPIEPRRPAKDFNDGYSGDEYSETLELAN